MTDLTILGGGAAGCRAAALAAKAGFSVVLIENDTLGGSAARDGYWPYKHLLANAAALLKARSGASGQSPGGQDTAYQEMVGDAREAALNIVANTRKTLVSLGVNIVNANGRVNGLRNHRYAVSTGDSFYESRRLLLSTGSIPAIPELHGIDYARQTGFAVAPHELLSAGLPEKTLLFGGTLHDLQMAAWLAANRVPVTLASPMERVAAVFDPEVSSWLSVNMEGVEFIFDAGIASVEKHHVTLTEKHGGRCVKCDKLVVGGKRFPATRGIGLNNAAIATDGGAVITDLTCHTNLPDVFAAGDVNMRTMSALGAMREAEVCVSNMLGRHNIMAYHAIPYIFDCGVKAASVGETERSAEAMGYRISTAVTPLNGRREEGFVKLVADERSGGKLLGAHMCGRADGIEVINELAHMIEKGFDTQAARHRLTPCSTFADAALCALMHL